MHGSPSEIVSVTYLKSLRVGTEDLLDVLAVLEEDKGGHGFDTDLSGDLLLSIDVDLVEAELVASGRLGNLFEDGTDDPAGTAPGGPEVDDDGLVTVDEGLELLVGFDCLDDHCVGCAFGEGLEMDDGCEASR